MRSRLVARYPIGLQGDFAYIFFKLKKKMRSSLVAKGEFAYGLKKVKKKDAKSPCSLGTNRGILKVRLIAYD